MVSLDFVPHCPAALPHSGTSPLLLCPINSLRTKYCVDHPMLINPLVSFTFIPHPEETRNISVSARQKITTYKSKFRRVFFFAFELGRKITALVTRSLSGPGSYCLDFATEHWCSFYPTDLRKPWFHVWSRCWAHLLKQIPETPCQGAKWRGLSILPWICLFGNPRVGNWSSTPG